MLEAPMRDKPITFDKRVTVGNMISIATMISAVFIAYMNLNAKVEVIAYKTDAMSVDIAWIKTSIIQRNGQNLPANMDVSPGLKDHIVKQ